MEKYQNKSIYFIGDSITANGSFVHLLRLYFENTGCKVFLHNKGIPGGSTRLVHTVLEEELSTYIPDFAVISFGANDVGYWEYNNDTINTPKLKEMRKQRLTDYMDNLSRLVDKLQEIGITPILCSPFPFNPYLSTQGEVKTEVDLKEKAEIDTNFYNGTVFMEINEALCEMGGCVKALAKERGIEFWDLFNEVYCSVNKYCFENDGIHYVSEGDRVIAKVILQNMAGKLLQEFDSNQELDEIAERELDERSYYFIKYIIMAQVQKGLSPKELCQSVRKWLDENGYMWGLTSRREEGFFRFASNPTGNQSQLIKTIRKE